MTWLAKFEWKAILPLSPNMPSGVPRVDGGRVLNDVLFCPAIRHVLGGVARKLMVLDRRLTFVSTVGTKPREEVGQVDGRDQHCSRGQGLEATDDRQHKRARTSEIRHLKNRDYCIGRSREGGGADQKIYLRVSENGLPTPRKIKIASGYMRDALMAEQFLHDLPRGTSLLADRTHDAGWIHDMIDDRDCTSARFDDTPFSKRKSRKCD